MRKFLLPILTLALLLPASVASAHDYMSESPSDWLRFKNTSTQQEKTSKIVYEYGNWRQWENFAGFGTMWVYTSPDHNYFWIWDGTTHQLVTNLDGQVGQYATPNIPPCNNGRVMIEARETITTPAGTFDTVKLALQASASCADAGTGAIWFAKGVGIVQWEEMSFIGPQTYSLSAAYVRSKRYPAAQPAPSTPVSTRAVAASEHDKMETILWGANDTYLVLDTYKDAFRGLAGTGVLSHVAVATNYIASQIRYEMTQAGVSLNDVEFMTVALDSVWMRDYGPIILKDGSGKRSVADLDYYYNRRQDNAFPRAYANYRGWARTKVNISYEGGNFATDGKGTAMSSLGVQWFNDTMSRSAIEREFAKLGCDKVSYFEPLVDEGTTHIDMFARVMSDTEALVSRYPSNHRQYRVCEDAANKMKQLGYQVTRVDVAYTYDEYATYSNSVLANGVALIPQYGLSTDSKALDAYRRLGYKAIGIDSKLIIKYSGATHCLSMQVPAGR